MRKGGRVRLRGRHLGSVLDGERTEFWAQRLLHESLRRGYSQTVTITTYYHNGKYTPNCVRLQPVRNETGVHHYTVNLQYEEDNLQHDALFGQLLDWLPSRIPEGISPSSPLATGESLASPGPAPEPLPPPASPLASLIPPPSFPRSRQG